MISVDTGYFIALLDRNDRRHPRAKAWMPSLAQGWVTTWPVLTEASYLIGRRFGEAARADFLEEVTHGGIAVWDVPRQAAKRLPDLVRRYASLPMDLADASLVLLAEHSGTGRILSTDVRDFGVYRFKSQRPFENLMLQEPPPT